MNRSGSARWRVVGVLSKGWKLSLIASGWVLVSLSVAMAPHLVELPALQGGAGVTTPFASLAAAVLAALSLQTASEPCASVFVTAPARARLAMQVRIVLVVVGGPTVVSLLGGSGFLATLNTTLALAGEGLLFAALGPGLRLGWLLPLGHFLTSAVVGSATPMTLHWWAWILEKVPSPTELVSSGAIMAIALVTWRHRIAEDSALLSE